MWRSCAAGHLTASALVVDPSAPAGAAHPAPAGRHVGAARRALRAGRPDPARRGRARGARGERDRRAVVRSHPARAGRAPDHLLARRADPALRRALPGRGAGGRRAGAAATSRWTCAGSRGTGCRTAWQPSCRAWSSRPGRGWAGERRAGRGRGLAGPDGRGGGRRAGRCAGHPWARRAALPAGLGDQAAGRAGRPGRGARRRRSPSTTRPTRTCSPAPPLRHLLAHASGLRAGPADADGRPGHPAHLLQRRHRAGRRAGRARHRHGLRATTSTRPWPARCGCAAPSLPGSPARDGVSTVADLARVLQELLSPTGLLSGADARGRDHGAVPGPARRAARLRRAGPQRLGPRVRDPRRQVAALDRSRATRPSTFGHFGQSGTMLWVDPAARLALVALTDRDFGAWAAQALAGAVRRRAGRVRRLRDRRPARRRRRSDPADVGGVEPRAEPRRADPARLDQPHHALPLAGPRREQLAASPRRCRGRVRSARAPPGS